MTHVSVAAVASVLAFATFARAQADDNPYAGPGPAPASQAAPADSAEDAPPLVPRFETPSEIAAGRKQPRFLTPTQASERAAHSGEQGDLSSRPSALVDPDSRDSSFCAVVTRPTNRAYFVDSTGITFARPPCRGTGPRAFYVRGFFSYLTNDFDEWSGAELGWQGSLARDFALGTLIHHEYREQRSLSLGAWMSARLHGGLHGYIGVNAGNATYYAPVTALDLEVGNQFDAAPRSYFALGFGGARYAEERDYWYGHLRHAFALDDRWRGEAKVGIGFFDAPTISLRPEPLAALSAIHVFKQGLEGEARIAYTLAPAYRPGKPPADSLDHPDLTIAIGTKLWFAPSYGGIAELVYERLWKSYDRFGLDYTVVFTGP